MDYNEFNKKFPLNIVVEEVSNVDEACWKGYKQLGMKKMGNKEVPNCVKESNGDDKADCDCEDKKDADKAKTGKKSKIDLDPKLDIERV